MAPLCPGGSLAEDSAAGNNIRSGHRFFSDSVGAADLASKRAGRPISRKLVVVGDGAAGKTSLLNVYVNRTFPQHYEPTVFETHVWADIEQQPIKTVNLKRFYYTDVDGAPVSLALWDTAGQEDFQGLRSLSYADTHVVLLCFAIDAPTSLENCESRWVEEIAESCPGVKLCLVACKCDLREDPATLAKLAKLGESPVVYEQGLSVARRIRASRYLECSAKHDRGVREAFNEAARVAVSAPRKGETKGSSHAGKRSSICIIS